MLSIPTSSLATVYYFKYKLVMPGVRGAQDKFKTTHNQCIVTSFDKSQDILRAVLKFLYRFSKSLSTNHNSR